MMGKRRERRERKERGKEESGRKVEGRQGSGMEVGFLGGEICVMGEKISGVKGTEWWYR